MLNKHILDNFKSYVNQIGLSYKSYPVIDLFGIYKPQTYRGLTLTSLLDETTKQNVHEEVYKLYKGKKCLVIHFINEDGEQKEYLANLKKYTSMQPLGLYEVTYKEIHYIETQLVLEVGEEYIDAYDELEKYILNKVKEVKGI